MLLQEAIVEGHSIITGPSVLASTSVGVHSFIGRHCLFINSFIGQFVKCQVGILADQTGVASHAAVDGGTHAELYPLTANGSIPALVYLHQRTWVGHHASLTAGARIGKGTVIAAYTHIDSSIEANKMVAGSPARPMPLDFKIRGQNSERRREHPRRQADRRAAAGAPGRVRRVPGIACRRRVPTCELGGHRLAHDDGTGPP